MDQILEQLINLIVESQSEVNGESRLPTERELAETLGLNRAQLREKMAVLEALGFISRTQGRGTFVTVPRHNFQKYYYEIALKLGYITIDQLQDAREMIEMEMVRAAARNATDEDIRALEYFLNRMLETADAEYGADLDVAFHMALGAASHNPVIKTILESLSMVLRQLHKKRRVLVSQAPSGLTQTDATHIDVFEAVKNRDPEAAQEAMSRHFSVWRDFAEKARKYLEGRQAASSGANLKEGWKAAG